MASKRKIVGNTAIVTPESSDLERLVPDLQNWPKSWSFEQQDIPFAQDIVKIFTPYLLHLLDSGYSRKTLHQHRDFIWMLGGRLVEERQLYRELRKLDARSILLRYIDGQDGGPLLDDRSEREQGLFDATCRKLCRFLNAA